MLFKGTVDGTTPCVHQPVPSLLFFQCFPMLSMNELLEGCQPQLIKAPPASVCFLLRNARCCPETHDVGFIMKLWAVNFTHAHASIIDQASWARPAQCIDRFRNCCGNGHHDAWWHANGTYYLFLFNCIKIHFYTALVDGSIGVFPFILLYSILCELQQQPQ